jgi:hypothetical protein
MLKTHIYKKTRSLQAKWNAVSFRVKGKRVGVIKRGKLTQACEVARLLKVGPSGLESLIR